MLIAQITDAHVTRDGEQARYLSEVITWINARERPLEAVVLSGDNVNSGQREEYAILRDILAGCRAPVYVVPGNHDRRDMLRGVLPEAYYLQSSGDRLHYVVESRPVRLVGLDTAEFGRVGGSLTAETLAWLDGCLAAGPQTPTLIFMHHPPFRSGVNAADAFGFRGLRRFRSIVARHSAVRRIVAGHIHCERGATIAQALATTSVSCAPQRVPEIFERHILALRPEPPGFTLHAWSDGGFVSTTLLNDGTGTFTARGSS